MTTFKKYQHIEKFGNDEVSGIDEGTCYIFPKLDGTNASVWLDENKELCAGSRNRKLSLESDNAGFFAAMCKDEKILEYLNAFPNHRLFGEWLVPHSFKKYQEDAWRKFYIFDVTVDDNNEEHTQYIHYDAYSAVFNRYELEYIPAMAFIKHPTVERIFNFVENAKFLVRDGEGAGEGIVIKNYDFRNKYGHRIWAKIVTNDFKKLHSREMGPNEVKEKQLVELLIAEEFVTKALVEKVHAKISNEMDGWTSRYIPRLLQTVYYDLIKEESWTFVKKYKNPTISFGLLQRHTIIRIKELMPELF